MEVRFAEQSTLVERDAPRQTLGPCCGFTGPGVPSEGGLKVSTPDVNPLDRRVGKVCVDPGSRDVSAFAASNSIKHEAEQRISAVEDKDHGDSLFDFPELMAQILALNENQVVYLCTSIFAAFPNAERRLNMNCSPLERLGPCVSRLDREIERQVDHTGSLVMSERKPAQTNNLSKCAIPETADDKIRSDRGLEAKSHGEDGIVKKLHSEVHAASESNSCCQFASHDSQLFREVILSRLGGVQSKMGTSFPAIQFESPEVYTYEHEYAACVDVIRIGRSDCISKVCWETRDGSALAGIKYVSSSGELVFKKGQRVASVKILLLDNLEWNATLNFKVVLLGNTCHQAHVTETLSTCIVKILDNEIFPGNWQGDKLTEGKLHSINTPLLFLEYVKVNLKNPIVKLGSCKILAVDQFSNLSFVFGLALDLFVMEGILCTTCISPDSSSQSQSSLSWAKSLSNMELLCIVALIRIAPHPIGLYLDYRKKFFKVAGTSRMTLQSNLIRKFLSYTSKSREEVGETDLVMAMTRDTPDLVERGFCKCFDIIKNCTRVVLLMLFLSFRDQLLGDTVSEAPEVAFFRVFPALMFPVFFGLFLKYRNKRTVHYLEEEQRLQNGMIDYFRHILASFDIIRDYNKIDHAMSGFEASIRNYNDAFVNCSVVSLNNKAFAPMLTVLLMSFFTAYGGARVFDGLSLGKFVNTLQVYSAIGGMLAKVYENLSDLQNSFDALHAVVWCMNLPLDLNERLELFRENKKRIHEQTAATTSAIDPLDLLSFELRNLHFTYRGSAQKAGRLVGLTMSIPQGGLFALVGPPSSGKGTLLKILCGILLPGDAEEGMLNVTKWHVVVPPHLQMLHIHSTPCFVEGTLLENLVWGVKPNSEDGEINRVVEICRRLGVSDATLEILGQDTVCDWSKTLSATEASLVHTARAIIADPDVLCAHKPTLYLQEDLAANLYEVLRKFVDDQGYMLDQTKFRVCRPRTCIVAARSATIVRNVDAAFYICEDRGLVTLLRGHDGGWVLPPVALSDKKSGLND
eukprot:TRINITY_DN35068_c0_g1_i1.p1 TRINITY_DN35068_c0_g1~~TRINITY_DN35068_c0_g1_i1.p1  ORF type:complete len:1030 (-),score=116.81 TRINITY_DN35068_c0_g1_i1:248-3337(-)